VSFFSKILRISRNKRSVIFYRQSYYHFFYLAKALRKRGWDAVLVNLDPVDGPHAEYYHGEDINLYDENPDVFHRNISSFFEVAKTQYKLMHFAGDGCLSFFPHNNESDEPHDILEWLKLENKIAYTVSGCSSGRSQSSISAWSVANNGHSVCERCIWQDNKSVCRDEKNLAWGKKLHRYCDLIFSEGGPALDFMKSGDRVIREPVSMCLDKELWNPNLDIPEAHRIPRVEDEILIYHAVGNYEARSSATKNIKGTPALFDAVERLKQEGYKVQLLFLTNKPSQIVRFYQAQADIIVDQLNYGRYGANAREGMMLGKPVVCYLNKFEFDEKDRLACLDECPLISATEDTIYDVLKSLILDATWRKKVGEESRNYALKWHDADACAERYEQIYDTLFL
jgi:hypothetical protein